MKKSQARIASAWERRNCGQAAPVRRGAGPVPLVVRISHTVDAATLTPRPASSPWILRYPHPGFSLASRRTRALMLRRVAGRPVLPRLGSGGPAAPDDVAVPAQDRVRGDQQEPVAARFRYHAEQGREQCPVRPGQVRAARLPPLQDSELVAQDQDLCGLPCLLTPGQPQPRDHPRDEKEGKAAGT